MRAISLAIWGATGTTKSSVGLSFPGVVCFDFDQRLGGVRKELLDSIVRKHDYPKPISIPASGETRGNQVRVKLEGYREQYDQFRADLLGELRKSDCLTVMIDTATQMREMINDAYLQELQEDARSTTMRVQLQQLEYGNPNGRIQAIYQAIKGAGRNLVLTHYDEDEYRDEMTFDARTGERKKESIRTGQRVMKGYNKTDELVDMVLLTSIEMVNGQPVPMGVITKAGLALEMLNMKIAEPCYETVMAILRGYRPEAGW